MEYEKFKQQIFLLMNGALNTDESPVPESVYVKSEYAAGELCAQRYEEIYKTILKINNSLKSEAETEHIMECWFDITMHLCLKMYDYGHFFALKESNENRGG